MSDIGFQEHDHTHCIQSAIASVEAHCAENKLKFTPIRRRVLEILLSDHKALGAYDILDQLKSEGLAAQPPVAYRALDFLVGHGFAHKIEKLNAYTACASPGHPHSPAFMICRSCHAVVETTSAPDAATILPVADPLGFTVERTVIEAEGQCATCKGAAQ